MPVDTVTSNSGADSSEKEFYLELEIDPEYREYCREFDRKIEDRYQAKSEEIRNQLAPYVDLASAHLLDLGCGRGAYGRLLMGEGGRVTGLDLNLTELSLAVESSVENQDYAFGNGYALPFRSDTFDLVLCRHTLEHLSRPSEFLSEIHRVTKPGGACYLSTPNLFSAACFLTSPDGRKWLEQKWRGRNRGVYRIYSLPVLRSEIERAGFFQLVPLPLPLPGWLSSASWLQHLRPTLKTILLKRG